MSWLNDAEITTAADKDRNRKDGLISQIESQRKEQENQGVTINGVRYAGNAGNRQALKEAVDMATELAITSFTSWKDSDGIFHSNHPVADVHSALLSIGDRRSKLIGKEGQFITDVKAGNLTDVSALDWTV